MVITEGQSKSNVHHELYFKKKLLYSFVKRLFDIVFSLLVLSLFSPVFIIVAILIKCNDGGPVFFCQERVGKNEKIFKIIKFRSMCVDAPNRLCEMRKEMGINENIELFKLKKDPRVTSIGRFIRKTSIDELPQFFNVLIGSMTVVGPRPALPHEVDKYDSRQKKRLLVKQGITGLWQIKARGNSSFGIQSSLDCEYVSKRSLLFDLKIIILTIPSVLFCKGAS